VKVPTKEKTNHGRGRTVLVIRRCSVANWCPLTCYVLLKAMAAARGAPNALWCTEQGTLYTQPSVISRELKALLVAAGIDRSMPAYSVRHALITFLIKLGFSEVEVNAYTGHSNNSHTAFSHYFHLDGNWTGRRIVKEALKIVPEEAERVIARDNSLQRLEEGEEPEPALESETVEAGKEELVRFDWTNEQSVEESKTAAGIRAAWERKGKEKGVTSQEEAAAAKWGKVEAGLRQEAAQPPAPRLERGAGEGDRVVPSDWG
jgi:hypothetical protein